MTRLVSLAIGLVLYLLRKRVKRADVELEFHPGTDASGDRIEFVTRAKTRSME